jgi:hypothetical protein
MGMRNRLTALERQTGSLRQGRTAGRENSFADWTNEQLEQELARLRDALPELFPDGPPPFQPCRLLESVPVEELTDDELNYYIWELNKRLYDEYLPE